MIGVALFVVTRMLLERTLAGTAEQKEPIVVVAAGLAALLFCVHPLRTEVVVWLSAQTYLPSVLCLILGVGAYLKAFDANRPLKSRRKWLAASFVLGGAAMLFKAVAVTYPLLLLVLDAYPLGRLTPTQGESGARRRWTLALVEKLPLLVLSLMLMVVAHRARIGDRFETGDPISAPLSARLADAAYGVWFYPCKTLVPIGLTIIYPREEESVVHLAEPRFALCRGRRGRGLPPGLASETKGAGIRGGLGGLPDHPGTEFRSGPVQYSVCGRPVQLRRVAAVGARACGRTGVRHQEPGIDPDHLCRNGRSGRTGALCYELVSVRDVAEFAGTLDPRTRRGIGPFSRGSWQLRRGAEQCRV